MRKIGTRDFLKKERKRRKLSQKEVADIIGISRETYCQIENGTRNPGFKTAVKIGEYFNIDIRLLEE